MVSAGLITFYQSLGIILGADIGTVLTVQLVVWKVTDLSPILVIVGGTLWFSGRGGWKTAGETILYFGLIFFGLYLAEMATAPLNRTGRWSGSSGRRKTRSWDLPWASSSPPWSTPP